MSKEAVINTIPFGKPIIGEEEKEVVWSVLESGLLVHGPIITRFEESFAEFTGAPHAVGVSSCTAALHLVYFALGIGPGDEVIVPAQTHTATAHAVELVGAKPVFVDANPRTGNISVDGIRAALTESTRAISLVHFLGLPADMASICALADQRGVPVIEDCALSLGATIDGTHTGLFGTVGCFSFYPVKHMTTGEGGMLICRDEELAARIANLRAFGVDRHHGKRKVPGMYDVKALGFNYRMGELQAAIGVEQLKRLPGFLERREANYMALAEGLRGIEEIELLETSHDGVRSSYYCLSVILKETVNKSRPDIMADLKERGIGTSIYYPRAVPLMSYYRDKYGYSEGAFPEAEKISNRSIALPVGPHLDGKDMQQIISGLKEIL
jgi:dTDP-4-amino-4,6-dideoxygalactose transaminase